MSLLALVILGAIGLYVCAWIYNKYTCGVCKCVNDLRGKTVIVTGGNTGIGLETARDLAARNARVILACRSLPKGEKAVTDIVQSTGNTNVVVKQLDLSSFRSVRDFAKDILENEGRLDILVNNAGVLPSDQHVQKNDNGLELVLVTNHLGPFLLTNLLLPMLKKNSPSRIVMVSSNAYEMAQMDFENLNGENSFTPFSAYCVSKLLNVLFTLELSEQLKCTGVTVNALHPGMVMTDMVRGFNEYPLFLFIKTFFRPFMKSPKEGSQTSIHLAVAEELEHVSGKYFSDCRERKLKKNDLHLNNARRLWDYSVKVTELQSS